MNVYKASIAIDDFASSIMHNKAWSENSTHENSTQRKFHPAKIPPSENSTKRKFHPAKIRLGLR